MPVSFLAPGLVADAVAGATAAITTIHPMGSDRSTQKRIGVQGTIAFARAAAAAGVKRLIHAVGLMPDATDADRGPVAGACTAVNVAAARGTQRDYFSAVGGAIGVDPVWDDAAPWTGEILAQRARGWGWTPTLDLPEALAEVVDGLNGG